MVGDTRVPRGKPMMIQGENANSTHMDPWQTLEPWSQRCESTVLTTAPPCPPWWTLQKHELALKSSPNIYCKDKHRTSARKIKLTQTNHYFQQEMRSRFHKGLFCPGVNLEIITSVSVLRRVSPQNGRMKQKHLQNTSFLTGITSNFNLKYSHSNLREIYPGLWHITWEWSTSWSLESWKNVCCGLRNCAVFKWE